MKEAYYIITFDNTHNSIEADKHLEELGVPHKLIPVPQKISSGCGFCLKLPPETFDKSLGLLHNRAIKSSAAYRVEKNGLTNMYIKLED